MGKLKNIIKKITAWAIMVSLVLGGLYWTDAKVIAKEPTENFKNYITTVVWNLNAGIVDGDTPYQFKQEDTFQASYEYEIPAGTVEGTEMELPISRFFEGTLISTSSDKVDVRVNGQKLKVIVKETEDNNSGSTTSPSAVSVSGPEVNITDNTINGIIVVDYSLHTGVLGEEPFFELCPNEINIESSNTLDLTPASAPDFLTTVRLLDPNSASDEADLANDSDNLVEKNATVSLRYDFKYADGSTLDTFTVNLPPEVQSESSNTYALNDKYEVTLCNATVTEGENGTITFAFTDKGKEMTNVQGHFIFPVNFQTNKIGKDSPKTISFDLGTGKLPYIIDVYFKQPAIDPSFQSRESAEVTLTDDSKGIKWTTVLKAGTNVKTDAVFTETWSQQTLDGAVTATSNVTGKTVNVSLKSSDNTGMVYAITNLVDFDENDLITIVYTTKADASAYTNPDGTTLKNEVTISGTEIKGTPKTSGNFKITPKIISQNCVGTITDGELHWTVVLNESTLNMYNATFSTSFDEYLELKPGSLEIENIGTVGASTPGYSYTDTTERRGFDYTFSNAPLNKTVTITFTTTIKEEFFRINRTDFEFSIGAKLTWWPVSDISGTGIISPGKWKGGTAQKFGITVFDKKCIGYDKSTGRFKWEISVTPQNPTNTAVTGVEVIDILNGDQTFHADSVKLNEAPLLKSNDYGNVTQGTYGYDGLNEIKINIGDISDNKKQIITLETKVKDANIYRNGIENFSYTNMANVTATTNLTDNSDHDKQNPPQSEMLVKSSEYIQDGHIIKWKVLINASRLPIQNAVITDALPKTTDGNDIVEYVPNSFTMKKIETDGTKTACNPPIPLNKTDTAFTYNFNDQGLANADGVIDGYYEMIYDTKVIKYDIFDANGATTIRNTAKLNGNSTLDEVAPMAECSAVRDQKVTVDVITKTPTYKNMDSFIKWTVTVNQDERPLKDAVITDDLSIATMLGNQTLDTSDMTLIKGVRKSDGNSWDWSGTAPGTTIAVQKSDFKYDAASKVFEFYLKDDIDQSDEDKGSAYQLTFTTKINDKETKNFKVTNNVTFKNKENTLQTAESTEVSVSLPRGGASGDTPSTSMGKLTVTLKDADDSTILLPNAEFELLDKFDNPVSTQKTDANGTLIFEDLTLSADYKVKQVTPTPGYPLITEVINIVTEADGKTEFKSKIMTTEFKFTKEADKPVNKKLAGAKFKLYTKSDTSFSKVIAGPIESDVNGKVNFNNIKYGDYVIVESAAPEGYQLTNEKITVTMSQGTADQEFKPQVVLSTETLKNTAKPGSIKIKLTDETGAPLENGKFEIETEEGNKWEETTPSTGIIDLPNLTMQTYTITQLEAPTKYLKDMEPKIITLEATDSKKEVIVKNTQITALIKVNVTSSTRKGRIVTGAVFGIYNQTNPNPLKQETSDKDGNVFFYNMPYGNYTVRQTKTIEGYLGLDIQPDIPPIDVNITDETPVDLAITNVEITGTVTVTILDKVPGVEYTLYDEDGNILAVAKTDKDGLLKFDDVVYGNHKMRQTDAPSGFENSDKEYDIIVKNQDDKEDIVIDSIPKTPSNNNGGGSSSRPAEEEKPEEVLPEEKEEIIDKEEVQDKEKVPDKEDKKKPTKKPAKPSKDKNNKEEKPGNNSNSNNGSGKGNDSNNTDITDSKNFNNSSKNSDRNNSGSNAENGRNPANSIGTSDRTDGRLPQSGAFFDFKLLVTLGAGLILMGSALKFRKKKEK